ncbi:hypothetical protein WMF45_04095 [Sorangium sp. So ce448]|uniref:hypothetical protein n=1 Tax=Sorangium sp. So ce448 TaxID=3133314 RepID=UPI003F5F3DCC
MRHLLFLGLLTAALATACGSSTTDPEPTGSGGSAASSTSESSASASSTTSSATTSSSATGATCAPGETMSCTCHAVGAPGVATCLADGSGYGPCMEQGGGACRCPLGRSDGCCPGDGICCACVQGCDPNTDPLQDAETDALIACVCAAGVCADECERECAGQGIAADCRACVQQAGADACKAEYEACGGT